MSQTDTETEAVGIKPFPAIRRELPKHHPSIRNDDDIQQTDKPLPTPTLTKVPSSSPSTTRKHGVALVSLVVNAFPGGLRRDQANDCRKMPPPKNPDELSALFPEADFRIIHKPVNEGKAPSYGMGSSTPLATSC